jgi:hypothetical protein
MMSRWTFAIVMMVLRACGPAQAQVPFCTPPQPTSCIPLATLLPTTTLAPTTSTSSTSSSTSTTTTTRASTSSTSTSTSTSVPPTTILAGAWSQRFGGGGSDAAYALAEFPDGGVVVSGSTTPPGANPDVPVIRYDAAGVVRWARTFGGAGYDYADGAAVAGDGGVVIGGRFQPPASFGGPVLTAPAAQDAMVVKLDGATGAFQWQRQANASLDAMVAGVAADASRIVATGYFRGTANFGTGVLTVPFTTDLDVYVANYGLDGTPRWARNFTNDGNDRGYDVALGSDGAIAVVGTFSNSINFGGGTLVSPNALTDAFLLVLEPTGAYRWARQVGAPDGSEALESVAFAGTDVVVCGSVLKPLDVGTGVLPALGGSDALVVLYGPSGAPVWARRVGSIGNDYAKAVAYDPATRQVLVVGSYERQAVFGGAILDPIGSGDVFLARYDAASGALVSVARYGGPDADAAYEVTPSGLLAGYFYGMGQWSGGALVSAGMADGFTARP